MFHVILHQPEIPPNTGNIIRLCANTGCTLHLIEPLGFDLGQRSVRRAGLDYAELAVLRRHRSLADCLARLPAARLFALETDGARLYSEAQYRAGDALLFGAETRGLPAEVLQSLSAGQRLRLPMQPGSRSLNLANAVAVVVYEAWRQCAFAAPAQPAAVADR